jgi:hypothetical protein
VKLRMLIAFGIFLVLCNASKAQQHNFYDKPAKIQVVINLSVVGADLGQSCWNLTHGGREVGVPTQSCAVIGGIMVAGQIAQESIAYFFHRRGHHKLERAVRFISLSANVEGLIYSHKHGVF